MVSSSIIWVGGPGDLVGQVWNRGFVWDREWIIVRWMMVWRAAKNAVKSVDCGQDCGKEWAVQQNTVCKFAGFDISGGFL